MRPARTILIMQLSNSRAKVIYYSPETYIPKSGNKAILDDVRYDDFRGQWIRQADGSDLWRSAPE